MTAIPSEIRKSGVLYRLAYSMTNQKDRPTETVNLCDLVWRAITTGILWLFLGAITAVVVGLIVFMAGTMLYALVVEGIPAIIHALGDPSSWTFFSESGLLAPFGFICFFFGTILTILLIIFGLAWFSRSEVCVMLRAFVRAKKERYCPILKVV